MSQPPNFDLQAMLRQAQEVGQRIQRAREELKHRTVEATVGGGVVKVTANGALEIVAIEIEPRAVDPRDVAMLRDLLVAGVNEALRRAREMSSSELQRITGLPLGGLFPGMTGGG